MAVPAVRRGVRHQFKDVSKDAPVEPEVIDLSEDVPRDTSDDERSQTPLMPAVVAARAVSLQPTSIEDIDQLWDWSRNDREGVKAFLGLEPKNSRDLFTFMGRVATLEQQGQAALRSIRDAARLIGFVMLMPITRTAGQPPVGTVHIYLEPTARGEIVTLLPSLLDEGERQWPAMTLCVITTREEWARILKTAGFTSQIVLTRHSSTTDSVHGT